MRFEPLVASAFSWPARISASEVESWSPPTWMRPESSSSFSGAAPLNAMCAMSTFASRLKVSPITCMTEPGPGRAVVVLQLLALQQRAEVAQVLRRHARVRGDHERHVDRDRDAVEVGLGVERRALGERLRDRGQRERDVGHQQRVAVGRGLRHDVGAERAARAAAVVHHDRLLHGVGEALRDEPRDDVGRAARRERHDDADRLRRIGLRQGGGREQHTGSDQQRSFEHCIPSLGCCSVTRRWYSRRRRASRFRSRSAPRPSTGTGSGPRSPPSPPTAPSGCATRSGRCARDSRGRPSTGL